jgi:cytochrome c1
MKYALYVLASMLIAIPAFAAKTYQVTGPVLEVSETAVVVQKGKEKWEIARSSSTPIKGDLQKGAKVTVEYTMSATNIEVKPSK